MLDPLLVAEDNRGEKLTLNVDMSSDGEWTWIPMPVTP